MFCRFYLIPVDLQTNVPVEARVYPAVYTSVVCTPPSVLS